MCMCMRRQIHWGAAGLEPLTCLVTDVLAGGMCFVKKECLLTEEGDCRGLCLV